jgi:glycosyltransferase
MKVSIITASLNNSQTIRDTISSVLSQDYLDIEHIIIDGNSSDGTLEIIKDCQSKNKSIKLFIEFNNGAYNALNQGLRLSSGDIIGFLHSDDLFGSKTIISEITSIFENNDINGVYGDLQYVKNTDISKVVRNWKSRKFYPEMIKKAWMPAHPTLFLKKEVYEKHGNFDPTYKISADYEFIIRIFKDQFLIFEHIPKVITKMRLGGISNRSLKNIFIKSLEDYRAMKKHKVGNILTLARKTLSKLDQYFKR